ncbi:hypothetical protein SAMN05421636_103335 [Pricia antarctica]|uniref:Uncharacterized protein n=1 Tax=Pricia antarctica TaxID=641691 RepID=A0A1G7ADH7_9FLAO|nr:hypothetical protein SAMN05421636_103335 [Pricia antarctica]
MEHVYFYIFIHVLLHSPAYRAPKPTNKPPLNSTARVKRTLRFDGIFHEPPFFINPYAIVQAVLEHQENQGTDWVIPIIEFYTYFNTLK